MANSVLASLESALRARKLDRTLTTALPSSALREDGGFLPTTIEPLDARLRGGLPRGQLSEIVGPRSSGRTTLLLQVLAAATRRGDIVALIDTFDRLDVPSLMATGLDAERLLWVRGDAIAEHAGWCDRTVDRALKALNLVLQAGGFACVALDFADVPAAALTRIPYTTWRRVQRVLEGRETACLLVASQPTARSAGGLTLSMNGRTRWAGATSDSRHLCGAEHTARVGSPRQRVTGTVSWMARAAEAARNP